MDVVVDCVLAVYEALIPTQEHFSRTPINRPRYFGYALPALIWLLDFKLCLFDFSWCKRDRKLSNQLYLSYIFSVLELHYKKPDHISYSQFSKL